MRSMRPPRLLSEPAVTQVCQVRTRTVQGGAARASTEINYGTALSRSRTSTRRRRHNPALVQAANRRCAVAGLAPKQGGNRREAHVVSVLTCSRDGLRRIRQSRTVLVGDPGLRPVHLLFSEPTRPYDDEPTLDRVSPPESGADDRDGHVHGGSWGSGPLGELRPAVSGTLTDLADKPPTSKLQPPTDDRQRTSVPTPARNGFSARHPGRSCSCSRSRPAPRGGEARPARGTTNGPTGVVAGRRDQGCVSEGCLSFSRTSAIRARARLPISCRSDVATGALARLVWWHHRA